MYTYIDGTKTKVECNKCKHKFEKLMNKCKTTVYMETTLEKILEKQEFCSFYEEE